MFQKNHKGHSIRGALERSRMEEDIPLLWYSRQGTRRACPRECQSLLWSTVQSMKEILTLIPLVANTTEGKSVTVTGSYYMIYIKEDGYVHQSMFHVVQSTCKLIVLTNQNIDTLGPRHVSVSRKKPVV